jgi:poly(3-hydroxybutyrate) depolymerase
LIPRVVALQNPQQSYALYVPTKYSRERRWPIVYVFDPLARGPLALAQFQHAAEIHGYIVAVSNNSRNGPWQPEFEAAEAMVGDTQQRFTVDLKRIYFAGFSGGARVASQLAAILQNRTA